MRRAAGALLMSIALIAAACSSPGSSGDATDTPDTPGGARGAGSPFAADDLLPLHLEGGDHARIADSEGRQVLLRGVNLNTLGDYFQANPDLDPTHPYDPDDFADMAALGFDVVRLLVHWSRLEPEPGRIDDDYVAQIHRAVDDAAAHGLYTVIDLHQDAYAKFVASPPGTVCPDGQQAAIGWDGAPEWATLTDGASTCNNGSREAAAAVNAAWRNLYADTDGIRSHLIDLWQRLGREFADVPAVAGYDLLNEPGFGDGLDGTITALDELYAGAVDAVRRGEAEVEGSTRHLVFYEPTIGWATLFDFPRPSGFSDDADLVFAPHLYAESIPTTGIDMSVADGFANAAEAADAAGTTFWSGEYGWFDDPEEQAALVDEYARQEDRYLVGGAWWQWRQACGDPHSVGATPPHEPPDVLVHLHRTQCPSGDDLGLTQPWATTLSRSYPRAAPGRLTHLRSDPASGAARIRGEVAGRGTLELWVPDRGAGDPQVTGAAGDGAGVTVTPGVDGSRVSVPVEGTYDVRVTPGA